MHGSNKTFMKNILETPLKCKKIDLQRNMQRVPNFPKLYSDNKYDMLDNDMNYYMYNWI